jgi:hypothetical protein
VNPAPADEEHAEADLELADEHLIRYWTHRFRCTPVELLAVVARTGRSIAAVRAEIARRASLREASRRTESTP